MRTGRGLIPTFGASVSLVAAGTLALFVVSAVVAFNGWPQIGTRVDAPRSTELASAPGAGPDSAGTATVALAPPPRQVLRPVKIAPRRSQSTPATRRPQRSSPRPTAAPQATAPAVGQAVTPPPSSPAVPAPAPALGESVREVTGAAGGTLGQTTGALGQTVKPLSPALAQTVEGAGGLLDKTVTDLGATVGGVLDRLGGR